MKKKYSFNIMLITKIILGFTCLVTFLFPNYIQNFTGFTHKETILNIWNIYALVILITLFNNNIKKSLSIGVILTIVYYIYLLKRRDISPRFFNISVPLNLIVLIDLMYFSKN